MLRKKVEAKSLRGDDNDESTVRLLVMCDFYFF